MLAFENQTINILGTFPNTQAKNASSAGAQDGTAWLAPYVNHDWGWEQDLMVQAQFTPSGITESAAASAAAAAGAGQQMRQAFEMKYGAPGELVFDCIVPGSGTYGAQAMAWGVSSGGAPARYQYRRVVPCAGQVVLIANYPDLCAAIYCGDANNATADYCYKSTDSGGSSHSTSGTYMRLPDFRGLAPRGYDHGAVHDPLGATRGISNSAGLLASLQQDALQGHYHSNVNLQTTTGASGVPSGGGGTGSTASAIVTGPTTDGSNGNPRTSSETRMYNASCNIGIRF
jgi:hypothetical protein